MRIIKTAVLALLMTLVLGASTFQSDGNETCAPAPCQVQVITPHPAWLQDGQWISYTDSGANAGMTTVPNGRVVSFFETLHLAGPVVSAFVKFAADDSASLYVNGSLLVPEAPAWHNHYSTCSDVKPTCWKWTEVDLGPWLIVGTNVIQFDVAQRAGWGFGLSFLGGVVTDDQADAPEPNGFALISIGCFMLIVAYAIANSRRPRI